MKSLGLLALACTMAYGSAMAADDYTVYIGTYTGPKSQGIYKAKFDSATGKLSAPELAVATASPSFLALHPNRPVLYAVGEGTSIGPKKEGGLSSFKIDTATGKLELLNQQPSGGGGPCHVSVDATGKCVLVANYGSGSVASFPVNDDGQLGAAASVIQHTGSSVDQNRQRGPHAHQIITDSTGKRAYVCDLGLDKVLVYKLDPAKATLTPNEPPFARVKPGAGPRHMAFHPNAKYGYVLNEMGSTVTAFRANAADGSMEEFQTIRTLPEDFKGNSSCAEIEVHPSGKFLYASNRGHDSVAVFAIAADGRLSVVEHESTGGKTPRFFGIAPSGKWLLAANQDSDSVVVFALDTESGKISSTGQTIEVGKPVCLVFRK